MATVGFKGLIYTTSLATGSVKGLTLYALFGVLHSELVTLSRVNSTLP